MMKRTESLRGRFTVLLAFFFVAVLSVEAFAYTSPIDVARGDHNAGASRKLGRGVANTGLGWTEVFKGIRDVSDESGFWAGATWGPIYGLGNAIRRTGAGIYETATFPFAGPNRFEPVIEPEFPLSDQ